MSINGIRSVAVPMGPVRVRMTGVVRDLDRNDPAAINAPKIADARAELERTARVNGADEVVGMASDYRRTALAAGPGAQWRVEVQAWGTAMGHVEVPDPATEAADRHRRKAEKTAMPERPDAGKDPADQARTQSTDAIRPDARNPMPGAMPPARNAPEGSAASAAFSSPSNGNSR